MNSKSKRVLCGVGAIVAAVAIAIGGTYAYTAFDHRNNPFRNAPNYQGRLVEDYEEKEWEIGGKIKKEVSVKNMGGTAQFPGKNWGDIYVRVKLKEHMDITPAGYVYYPVDATEKTRFMTDKEGSFVRFAATGSNHTLTGTQLNIIRSDSTAWNNVISDSAKRTTFTGALGPSDFVRIRGYYDTQDWWYIVTKANDLNGQYGSFVVADKGLDVTRMQSITGSTRAAGIDYGSGQNIRRADRYDNSECAYMLHFWDAADPALCALDTHKYAQWELGPYIMFDGWDGLPVDAWILNPLSGWATWGNALKPGESTDLLLKSVQPIMMPDGELFYVIHADMQCTDLNDMLTGDWKGDPWDIKYTFRPGGGSMPKIATIVTRYGSGWIQRGTEYLIDLRNQLLLVRDWGPLWDSDYPYTEDFTYVRTLDLDKIETFLEATEKHGFADWEPWYEWSDPDYPHAEPPTDLPVWGVETTFADWATKSSGGYCAYPDTWDAMRMAFYELTGVENVWKFAARPVGVPFSMGPSQSHPAHSAPISQWMTGVVSTKAELDAFVQASKDIFVEPDPGYKGWAPLFAAYDEAYFEDNALVFLEFSAGPTASYTIDSLTRVGDSLQLNLVWTTPEGPPVSGLQFYWLSLEVKKSDIAGVTAVKTTSTIEYIVFYHTAVQVNTHARAKQETSADQALVVTSKAQLEQFVDAYGDVNNILTPKLAGYDDAFFSIHSLVLITRTEPSGSISHRITDVVRNNDTMTVSIQRNMPYGEMTWDMAYWVFALEVEKDSVAGINAVKTAYTTRMKPDPAAEILTIRIAHHDHGHTIDSYLVNLRHKSFSGWPMQGNSFHHGLGVSEIEAFRVAAQQHGFAGWEESYVDENIADGHQWSIEIEWADYTQKRITGSNAYPATWEAMAWALESLTGIDVLNANVGLLQKHGLTMQVNAWLDYMPTAPPTAGPRPHFVVTIESSTGAAVPDVSVWAEIKRITSTTPIYRASLSADETGLASYKTFRVQDASQLGMVLGETLGVYITVTIGGEVRTLRFYPLVFRTD